MILKSVHTCAPSMGALLATLHVWLGLAQKMELPNKTLFYSILRIQMLGAFYCISTGRLILSTIALINNSASNTGSVIWKMGIIFLNSVGADLLRFLWITIFVERYVATIYSMEYEKKKFIFLPILLTLFTFTLTTMLAVCRHARKF